MYLFTPLLNDMIMAMPMMPMDPAKDTSRVLVSLVIKLFRDRPNAVSKPILALPKSSLLSGTSSL